MTQMNTQGMSAAQLDERQLQQLMAAEKELNSAGNGQKIYLLAVARPD